MEVATAVVLNWQLFGEKYEFGSVGNTSYVAVHHPLIVIKAVHSDRLTHPFGEEDSSMLVVHLYSPKYLVKASCFLASLLIAYIGIFVALLWMRRFFHYNTLNIIWWIWPIACLGAHAVLFMITNTSFIGNF
jgi:hypothetical protein